MTVSTTRQGSSTSRDDRRFYRLALAALAPLPMLAEGVKYLLNPVPTDGTVAEGVAALHDGGASTLRAVLALDTVFFAFLIPAIIAVALITRRTSPRLTKIGVVLTIPGVALGFGTGENGDRLTYLAKTKGLDPSTLSDLADEVFKLPEAVVGSLLFIIGIVFGLLVLGIALARSGAVPTVYGITLAAGGFTHPFLGVNHVVQGIGLLVASFGFLGASIALLRMSDDDFAPV